MKFGKQFREQQRREWAAYYVDYKDLKRKIKDVVQYRDNGVLPSSPNTLRRESSVDDADAVDAAVSALVLDDFPAPPSVTLTDKDFPRFELPLEEQNENPNEIAFFAELDQAIKSINDFYLQKEIGLVSLYKEVQDAFRGSRDTVLLLENLLEFFVRDVPGLERFRELNKTAFRKILKKHDKCDTLAQAKASVHSLRQSVDAGKLTLIIQTKFEGEEITNLCRSLINVCSEFMLDQEISILALNKHGDDEEEAKTSDRVFHPLPSSFEHYVLTVMDKTINMDFMNDLTATLSTRGVSVYKIQPLARRSLKAFEITLHVPAEIGLSDIKSQIFAIGKTYGTDLAIQRENMFRRHKRLVVFDMDSTLIQQEVIDELAAHAGVKDRVADITARAMRGEIDFEQSLRERVSLLADQPVEIFSKVKENLVFTDGAHVVCKALRRLGYKLAVISGGFTVMADHVKKELGLDYAFSNRLQVERGKITGRLEGQIVTARRKADLLYTLAQQLDIEMPQIIAIGDGANDLFMLEAAGLGIAFCAKPRVRELADTSINVTSLEPVLYLLGIREDEVEWLLQTSQ